MASLALVLVFCVFVSLSDSACFRKKLQSGAEQCQDRMDKSWHPVGSTWTNSKCFRCVCSATDMECCHKMGKVVIQTEGCVVKYDYNSCTFDVVNPDDPSVHCSYGAVGK